MSLVDPTVTTRLLRPRTDVGCMADVDRADLTYAYSRPFARHCATHDSFGFLLPIVLGLGEDEAAAAIGISVSKFRTLVQGQTDAAASPNRRQSNLERRRAPYCLQSPPT
jgi:hypothetical protein